MKKYKVIYADPPWSYNDKMSGHSFSLDHEYETQDLDWIKKLDIQSLADDDCCLFLWVVNPLLPEALEVIKAWEFKYKTLAFCWVKKTVTGEVVSNLGRWTMGGVELCLLATKGKPQRIEKNIKQLVFDIRTEHSRKPDEIRDRIVKLMGDIPRIELFARDDGSKDLFGKNRLDGWDAWGNEVINSVDWEIPAANIEWT
jgi:site-specific DNA-methyltransferase (adenine-specific)